MFGNRGGLKMMYECDNCEGLVGVEDVVLVFDEYVKALKPLCRKCWNIMNCRDPNNKGN